MLITQAILEENNYRLTGRVGKMHKPASDHWSNPAPGCSPGASPEVEVVVRMIDAGDHQHHPNTTPDLGNDKYAASSRAEHRATFSPSRRGSSILHHARLIATHSR